MSEVALDPEIAAMGTISGTLSGLDSDEIRARVLRWAAERYGVSLTVPKPSSLSEQASGDTTDNNQRQPLRATGGNSEPAFNDFVDLFDAVDPKSDIDKALTAAYWLQAISKQPSWQSLRVNNLLKDTGHGLANVTATLKTAQGRKPALVRQVAKSGKAQQAWKTYKLTTSGMGYIRDKLGLTGPVPTAMADNGEDRD
jgi:hypothetical protein